MRLFFCYNVTCLTIKKLLVFYVMAKTFYSQLKAGIGVDTLFDLSMASRINKSMTPDAVKEEMSRLSKKGQVKRLGYGVYIIDTGKMNEETLENKFISFRYIGSGKNVCGFYYGDNFVRNLKGAALTKTGLEIVTNKATSGKKSIYQFGRRLVLRKPYAKITQQNVSLLSFLTYISYASEEELKRNYSVLANYVREEHLSAPEAIELLTYFPGKTAKALLGSGFYKLMWKH